ncbi:rod-binding protein [Roseospira visakhapatnamensis]|uniref:Rod binding domain-containing protein n=1 Tax=Roseospira visakhapatnamensis TaxID=390880 RepID=A0A7W6RAN7_9PROT|nr:rod-binding protein [Roseospira visakhapatnamensis]MBB4264434.1 Rod binding domain-containing protein [Roseospira visakhapatnamensis]
MIDGAMHTRAALATETARADGAPLTAGRRFRDASQAAAAARDFEAFFLGQMLQPMFSGLSTAPPFGGGHAEQVWRSLMVDEYGKMMAASGRTGIADAVMRTMLSQQEV